MPTRALCAAAMQQSSIKRLDELFAAEPDRLSRLSFETAGIYFDWSKTHLDQQIIDEFLARADQSDFAAQRDALFAGEIVNPSEARPASRTTSPGSRDSIS
jgi:glucose-6-phosphate isomerase